MVTARQEQGPGAMSTGMLTVVTKRITMASSSPFLPAVPALIAAVVAKVFHHHPKQLVAHHHPEQLVAHHRPEQLVNLHPLLAQANASTCV